MTFDKRKKIRIGRKERHVKKDDNLIYNKPGSSDLEYVGSISKHRKESSEVQKISIFSEFESPNMFWIGMYEQTMRNGFKKQEKEN
tara:strand:- start:303 stop:560 length:258 start_codon:yes stop_codon:yes gene_type:complete